ncbi:RNA-guided endonuclease TnpB family protein [Neobacillus niacini]|uniref:RNA-guided endonuclease TnpB family protein n=1 Tax=Neobacillus niacini TaxID=86668 RepID=UPI002860F1D1|nr:RNA-guided endonuclease TnpB family protein [Neobacillus niacini]MDR6998969.1 putative transposase [Neobacillus niacini]
MAKRKTTKEKNEELAKDGLKLRHYGLKLRMEPNKKQKEQIHQTAGCSRFAFNFYLGERKEVYRLTNETLSVGDFKKSFNVLKEHPMFNWLKKADKFALETAMESVEDAFQRFFKGQNGFPKFKSKHKSEKGYTTKETNGNIKLDIQNQMVQLPKLGKVKIRLSKKHCKMFQENGLKGKIKTATIKYHSSGQYYVSLKIEEIIDLPETVDFSTVSEDKIIGLDLGLNHFYIDSNGKKVDNPKFLKTKLKKLAKLQRQLKNKKIGSSNYKKLQQKISKLHLHIANMRKDFLHKESRKLVNENQVIVLEDLNVKGMIKNKKLACSIADVSWSMFKTFVSYKADWANKKVIPVDRFFASSKQCNGCHEKNTMLSLSDRDWVCPNCGTKHDRDVNAAKNIKEEGIRILN